MGAAVTVLIEIYFLSSGDPIVLRYKKPRSMAGFGWIKPGFVTDTQKFFVPVSNHPRLEP